mgnify:CR=1 FL=1
MADYSVLTGYDDSGVPQYDTITIPDTVTPPEQPAPGGGTDTPTDNAPADVGTTQPVTPAEPVANPVSPDPVSGDQPTDTTGGGEMRMSYDSPAARRLAIWGAVLKMTLRSCPSSRFTCCTNASTPGSHDRAISAIVAVVHDVFITVGIYALVGFDVTPATVIGFLTILGYSLYDTVVVFDKVRENTKSVAANSKMTYSQAANLAVNQTIVRSINTSVIALLPVGSILFVGAGLLGAGTLKDLSLALFIGLAVGTYSSIFIAPPFLAQLREKEPAMQALAKRVASRGDVRTPVVAAPMNRKQPKRKGRK